MTKLKIKFTDFWAGFIPGKNYFFDVLSSTYDVELSDTPDLLIFSCYGQEYLRYNCTRVFYSAENIRPDFTGCDYAITFDYNDDARHYRLPLYAMYLSKAITDQFCNGLSREEAIAAWRSKSKFCCMVVSNEGAKERLDFFTKLSQYKKVDSGGRVLNNVGGPVVDKRAFIKDYRFVISFENSSNPGYTTEKIVEPLVMNSIPIYWGDPMIENEFNLDSILVLDPTKSQEELVAEIARIDNDEELAVKMLMAPKFKNTVLPESIQSNKLSEFFSKILEEAKDKKPVSRTFIGYFHIFRVIKKKYSIRIKLIMKKFTNKKKYDFIIFL